MKVFANQNLRATIDHQGRLHSWLGRRVGLSKTMLSHVTAGRKAIDLEIAEQIASILEVPPFLVFDIPSGINDKPNGVGLTGRKDEAA